MLFLNSSGDQRAAASRAVSFESAVRVRSLVRTLSRKFDSTSQTCRLTLDGTTLPPSSIDGSSDCKVKRDRRISSQSINSIAEQEESLRQSLAKLSGLHKSTTAGNEP